MLDFLLNNILPLAVTAAMGWLAPKASAVLNTKRKTDRAHWLGLIAQDFYRQYVMEHGGKVSASAWALAVNNMIDTFVAQTGVSPDIASRVLRAAPINLNLPANGA